MKFSEGKHGVLYPGWNNAAHRDGLGSSFVGRAQGVVVDENWNMSQQCTLAVQKTISIPGCFDKGITGRLREVYSTAARPL